jgi:hypothetical protein
MPAAQAIPGCTIAGDAKGRVTGRSLRAAAVGHRDAPKMVLQASKS